MRNSGFISEDFRPYDDTIIVRRDDDCRTNVVFQARATFFGRGPHQYVDHMSGATRPESFTIV